MSATTMSVAAAAEDFLSQHRIAVTGVSRTPAGHGSNAVYVRLRDRGYQVFAVNPNAAEVEGDAAYPSLSMIPGGVAVVVIGTRQEHADGSVREAVDLGVRRIWMHRGFGGGSVSRTAVEYGRSRGATVIDGGCPLMFGAASDGGHRVMCRVLSVLGAVPRRVS